MDPILIKRLLGELVVPPAGPLLVVFLGWFLGRFRPRLGAFLSVAGVLSLWLLATPFIADRLVRSVEDYPPLDPDRPTGAQAIVILAGGTRHLAPEYGGEDAPKVYTLQRMAYGAAVARATHLPVAVSGGIVHGGEAEALVMKRFLERDFRQPVAWAETASRDTHQNAVFTARMLAPLGIHRIILVTSSPHMHRSIREFRAAGFEPVAAPAGMATQDDEGFWAFVPSMNGLSLSQMALHELIGDAVLRLTGR
jgi:uncharacterized SAM-binding protein YcdF (DUF218 family)